MLSCLHKGGLSVWVSFRGNIVCLMLIQTCGWQWLELESSACQRLRASTSSFTPSSVHWASRCMQTVSLLWPRAMELLACGSPTCTIKAMSRRRKCINSRLILHCICRKWPIFYTCICSLHLENGIRKHLTTCWAASDRQTLFKWVYSFNLATTSALNQPQWVVLCSFKKPVNLSSKIRFDLVLDFTTKSKGSCRYG